MIKYLLLLFIGLAWGQDKYPYFKDMNKQLKFEQKKILVSYDKIYKITKKQTSFIPACLGGFSILGGYLTNKSKYIIEVQEKKIIPYLDGFFTVAQVKGMTEAYNRKIFDEISNK